MSHNVTRAVYKAADAITGGLRKLHARALDSLVAKADAKTASRLRTHQLLIDCVIASNEAVTAARADAKDVAKRVQAERRAIGL